MHIEKESSNLDVKVGAILSIEEIRIPKVQESPVRQHKDNKFNIEGSTVKRITLHDQVEDDFEKDQVRSEEKEKYNRNYIPFDNEGAEEEEKVAIEDDGQKKGF